MRKLPDIVGILQGINIPRLPSFHLFGVRMRHC